MKHSQDQKNIWKIIKVVPENQDTYSLYLEGSDEKFARRKAGQFVSLSIRTTYGWSAPHPFSIASAPEDPVLCLTIKKAGPVHLRHPGFEAGNRSKVHGSLRPLLQGY